MTIEWHALLAEHPGLAAIPPALRGAGRLQVFVAGETIFRQGDRPTAMLRVLSGEIRLIRRSADGKEIVLQRGREGFLAEASMTSSRYHCDAIAAEDGRLLRFPLRAFVGAIRGEPDFRDAWIAHLAREVRALRAQNERLNLRSADERILHYLEFEGGGEVTLTQSRKAWAAGLGLSHEALYRTLRRLREQGVIADDGRRIALVRPARSPRGDGQCDDAERSAGNERV